MPVNLRAAVSLCWAFALAAQDQPAVHSSPDRIDLGHLCRDGRAETSFAVFWHDKTLSGQKAELTLPPFVKLRANRNVPDDHTGAQTEVALSIDTSKLGKLKGDISVRCGGKAFALTVEATVLPPDPVATRLLVVTSPFEFDSTNDAKQLDAWRRIVAKGKLQVQYVSPRDRREPLVTVELLRESDVVLLAADGLWTIEAEQIKLLQGFVCGGGRLVVAASKFYVGTVAKANVVLEPFGLQMENIEPPVGRNKIEMVEDELGDHAWLEGIQKIAIHRPTPTRVTDEKLAEPLVRLTDEYAFAALARTKTGGEVVSLGTPIWWHWCTQHEDNARLLRRMLTRRR